MKHIGALSGGKDSTAMALRLAEIEPRDYIWVCTPTGDELPEMVEHWKRLGELLGTPLTPVTSGVSLSGLIRRWNALPNSRQRWCTRVLKIEPYQRFISELGECTSYVGLRADEETRLGMEFPDTDAVKVRFPLREWGWGLSDVLAYLRERDVVVPARTDCAKCYHQRLGEWWNLWDQHPEIFDDAVDEEATVTDYRGKQMTFRNDSRDTWPATLAGLRARFELGEVPKGAANQGELFENRVSMCRVCSL